MNNRRTTLLIALILAVGTGWLTLNYVSSLRSQTEGQPRDVLVATQDIPARMTITPAMFQAQTRPSAGLQPDVLSAPTAVVGQICIGHDTGGFAVNGLGNWNAKLIRRCRCACGPECER